MRAGGTIFVTGSGECDQLGLGDDAYSVETLTLVPALARVRIARLAVGGLHTLALDGSGRLWSWGCNDDCALGRGGAENRPGRVRGGLDAGGVTLIGAGDSHSIAVDATGRVWAWGTYKGSDGYLGFDADTRKQAEPRLMDAVTREYGGAVQLSCGADHSAVVTTSGVAMAWGYSGQGQLGKLTTERGLRGNRTSAIALTPYPIHIKKPVQARGVKPAAVDGVAAPSASTAGGGAAAGRKRARPAGAAAASASPSSSTALVPATKARSAAEAAATAVFCVGYSTFVATGGAHGDTPRLYACGLNNYGQLGVGDTVNRAAPEEVVALRGHCIVGMAGGAAHSLALGADGSVWAWGRGDSGQLGLSASAAAPIPVAASAFSPVQIPPSRFAPAAAGGSGGGGAAPAPPVSAADGDIAAAASSSAAPAGGCTAAVCVAANTCSSAAVTADGRLFTWGFGESGQLGTGRSRDENVPYGVRGRAGAGGFTADAARAVVAVGLGGQHCVVLVDDGGRAAAAVPAEQSVVVEDPPKDEGGGAAGAGVGEEEDDGMGAGMGEAPAGGDGGGSDSDGESEGGDAGEE